MVNWVWVVVALFGGASLGVLLTALCVAAGREIPDARLHDV